MKVRTFMPLAAAALIAVLMLALGAGTGAAKSDVQAAPAPYKVALVTDIGELDDRSFNSCEQGSAARPKKKLGVDGPVFSLEVRQRLRPEPDSALRATGLRPRDRGRLPDRRRDGAGGEALPEDEVRDHRRQRRRDELKGKPDERPRPALQGAGGRLPRRYLAALQLEETSEQPDVIGAVGGLKIPPVDRFIAGYQHGAKTAVPTVKVAHGYSQDFVDQAKCKEVALNQIANGAEVVFEVAGECGLGVLDAAKEKGVWAIGVDADQGYLGKHVLTSATKKVDVAVFKTIEAVEDGSCEVRRRTSTSIFTVANGRRRRTARSRPRAQPDLGSRPRQASAQQIASGQDQGHPRTAPPRRDGLGTTPTSPEGAGSRSRPFRYDCGL